MRIPLPILIIIISFFSCHQNAGSDDPLIAQHNDYFLKLEKNDQLLGTPKPGSWRSVHKEAHQSFEDYKKLQPPFCDSPNNVLFFWPVGNFTKEQLHVIELTKEYVSIFFQQRVELLPAISDSIIPANARRTRDDGHEQLLSMYFIDSLLEKNIPANGFVLMAITEKDLFPQPSWNFVFGQASYKKRVGVSSIYRLKGVPGNAEDLALTLKRLTNTTVHEIGHMFSLHHCTYAECVMNGSNSLAESDGQSPDLCSECEKKLFWNLKYDVWKRKRELEEFQSLRAKRGKLSAKLITIQNQTLKV